MRDFTSNFSDDDLLDAQANRNNGINRPDIDPAMSGDDGDDDWGNIGGFGSDDNDSSWDSGFSSGGGNSFGGGSFGGGGFNNGFGGGNSFGGDSFGGGGFNNGFGGGFGNQMGGFQAQYGQPQQNQMQQQQNPEDRFFEYIGKVLKGGLTFLKEFFNSFKTFDKYKWTFFGRNLSITGGVLSALGLLLWFLKVDFGRDIFLSGFGSLAIGIPMFACNYEDYRRMEKNGVSTATTMVSPNEEIIDYDTPDIADDGDGDFGNDGWETDDSDTNTTPVSSFDWDKPEDIEEPKTSIFSSTTTVSDLDSGEEEKVNPLDVIERMNAVKGYGRDYLFQHITAIMEHKTKHFSESVEFDEDSREFLGYCKLIEEVGPYVDSKFDSEPVEVIKVVDKLFFITIEVTRPRWLTEAKLSKLTDEVVAMCKHNNETGKDEIGVTGTSKIVGSKGEIKIMKGETAVVTLKDAFLSMKDTLLDSKNKMPIVIGVDQSGGLLWKDFIDVFALLVSGEPRSGKSWTVLALVMQFMMFHSPKDVNFIFMDPKNTVSDFYNLTVPHIRKFIQTDEGIVKTLKWLVKEEGERRRQLLAQFGLKDIKDLKKEHPDVELPYLFIVIDEVMTLISRMDDDTKDEFQSYLSELVTQLPSVGIRPILIPHVVKHSVLNKNITDNIPIRINVRGDAKAIESVTGAKHSEFPYTLVHPGDMAVKLKEGVFFAHSTIISDNNKGIDDVFNFLTSFWLKLEPDSFKGSKLESDIRAGIKKAENYPALQNMDLSYIEEDRLKVNSNRPKRDKSVKPVVKQEVVNDSVEETDDIEEVESVKEEVKKPMPMRNKPRIVGENTSKQYAGSEYVSNKPKLDAQTQHDILKNIHKDVERPTQKNNYIQNDDILDD